MSPAHSLNRRGSVLTECSLGDSVRFDSGVGTHVLGSYRPLDEWEADTSNCSICSAQLGKRFLKPRHHCRLCKRCVCSACSPNSLLLPGIEGKGPQRVCTPCVADASTVPSVRLRLAQLASSMRELQRSKSGSSSSSADGVGLTPSEMEVSSLDQAALLCEAGLQTFQRAKAEQIEGLTADVQQKEEARAALEARVISAGETLQRLGSLLHGLVNDDEGPLKVERGADILEAVLARCGEAIGPLQVMKERGLAQEQRANCAVAEVAALRARASGLEFRVEGAAASSRELAARLESLGRAKGSPPDEGEAPLQSLEETLQRCVELLAPLQSFRDQAETATHLSKKLQTEVASQKLELQQFQAAADKAIGVLRRLTLGLQDFAQSHPEAVPESTETVGKGTLDAAVTSLDRVFGAAKSAHEVLAEEASSSRKVVVDLQNRLGSATKAAVRLRTTLQFLGTHPDTPGPPSGTQSLDEVLADCLAECSALRILKDELQGRFSSMGLGSSMLSETESVTSKDVRKMPSEEGPRGSKETPSRRASATIGENDELLYNLPGRNPPLFATFGPSEGDSRQGSEARRRKRDILKRAACASRGCNTQ